MLESDCHASPRANRDAAKTLLRQLGLANVAKWCGRTEAAIVQWFSRATEAEPIPPAHVAAIVNGARDELGVDVPLGVLWPAMGHYRPADEDYVRKDFLAAEAVS